MELAYSIGLWMSAGGMIVASLLIILFIITDEFVLGETFNVAVDATCLISILIVFIGIGTLGLTGLVELCM